MKAWKQLVTLALLTATLLSLALPVSADVIFDPSNEFFVDHKAEFRYNSDSTKYMVNTEQGHAYRYLSPESLVTTEGIPNGKTVYIDWYYTDKNGVVWGTSGEYSDWLRMSDLSVVYDHFIFMEEHKSEMKVYEQGTYTIEATSDKPVLVWEYPGKRGKETFTASDIAEHVLQTYTDKNGIVWGYISYYMDRRNVWICMSDPYTDGDIAALEDPGIVLKAEPTDPADIRLGLKADSTPANKVPMSIDNMRILLITGSLIGGVVLLTAAAIVVIFIVARQKKKAGDGA